MAKTREQLAKDIKALKDAGLDASEEEAQLKALVLAGTGKPPGKAAPPATPPETEEDFVPLNTESYETGGGGWIAPESVGVKDAICEGFIVPDFVEDQLWFIFKSLEDADERFRGAFVCGALNREAGKSGAWKVNEVAAALGISNIVEVVPGQGIKGLKACEGIRCQVLWDDIALKGVTQRRIQDVLAPGAEPVL